MHYTANFAKNNETESSFSNDIKFMSSFMYGKNNAVKHSDYMSNTLSRLYINRTYYGRFKDTVCRNLNYCMLRQTLIEILLLFLI